MSASNLTNSQLTKFAIEFNITSLSMKRSVINDGYEYSALEISIEELARIIEYTDTIANLNICRKKSVVVETAWQQLQMLINLANG